MNRRATKFINNITKSNRKKKTQKKTTKTRKKSCTGTCKSLKSALMKALYLQYSLSFPYHSAQNADDKIYMCKIRKKKSSKICHIELSKTRGQTGKIELGRLTMSRLT